jgi:FAD/FMN-containing dehydrogenase
MTGSGINDVLLSRTRNARVLHESGIRRPPLGKTSRVADELGNELAEVVGAAHVLTDPDTRADYETDWTGRFGAPSRLVVRPATTHEVSAIVRICARHRAPIVPQGGNTGLVGGGVPRSGQVLLSLRRLAAVSAVDPIGRRLVAGAGATLAAVQRAASAAGLEFAVDLASRDSATVGGMVATNAGGIRVIRYGTMRAQLLGIEAVLADGSVVSRLSAPAHGNGGYDLIGLLAGSEGTLGVITRVALRLVPAETERAVALIGVDSTAAAVRIATGLRGLTVIDALEIFYADGLALVRARSGLRRPLESEWAAYVLAEVAGAGAEMRLGSALAALGLDDVALAVAPDDRRRLWSYRETLTEAIAAEGVPHKLDVALPLDQLSAFVAAVVPLVASYSAAARCVLFGHLGVGNLHVNVLGFAKDDRRVDDAVLRLVADLGGSIGAEHGIGAAKRDWLRLTRSAEDITAMRSIKRALDPHELLNPGVLLPPAD